MGPCYISRVTHMGHRLPTHHLFSFPDQQLGAVCIKCADSVGMIDHQVETKLIAFTDISDLTVSKSKDRCSLLSGNIQSQMKFPFSRDGTGVISKPGGNITFDRINSFI